jgi:ADP-heptose:LPS heptosyltransferase
LDRRLYRRFHELGRAIAPPVTARPNPASLRRVLIVRHDRIGDWVVTTPVVALLREIALDAEIDVLASPANASLIRHDGRVTRVIVNDHSWSGWLRALRELRARRYDLIISPIYYRHLREAVVAALVAREHTYTLSVYRPRRYQGPFSEVVRVPPSWRHMAERLLYVTQIGILGSVDARAEDRAATFLYEQGIGEFVAVNLSAAEAHREWSPVACADTLARLSERHGEITFLLTPPPGKEDAAAEVVRRLASPGVVAAPPGRLLDLVALLQRARVVITPDTANVHLAAACGRPVVVLTSALTTSPELWAPYGVPYRTVAAGSNQVSTIPADTIVEAFESLWKELGGVRPEQSA